MGTGQDFQDTVFAGTSFSKKGPVGPYTAWPVFCLRRYGRRTWAHHQGLNLKFTPVSEDDYESWVAMQGRKRYILTLLGRTISAANLESLARIITGHGLSIDGINRLSGRRSFVQPMVIIMASGSIYEFAIIRIIINKIGRAHV